MKGDTYTEVVADPKKTGEIKDADDLKAASAQETAMAKAKVPLLTATETAVNADPGCPRGEHLSTAAERKCNGGGDRASGGDGQEGDGETSG